MGKTNDDKISIKSLLSKAELRRLEKAAKDKNKQKLYEWAKQFEDQMTAIYDSEYEKSYEEMYQNELMKSIDNLYLTIIYTLHFNDSTKFGTKRINSFMNDFLETIDMFRRGEAIPEDYRKELEEDGVILGGKK